MELLSAFFLLYFLDRFHLTRAALSILWRQQNRKMGMGRAAKAGRLGIHSHGCNMPGSIFDPARIDDAMTQVATRLSWRWSGGAEE